MTLEIKINRTYIREITQDPFEFEVLEVTKEQLEEMTFISETIEDQIRDKFCFTHEKSRVLITISWFLPLNGPDTSLITCCPTFAERLQQILLKQGIFVHSSFLRVNQGPIQN